MDPRDNERLGAAGHSANPFAFNPLPVLLAESQRLFPGCELHLQHRRFGQVHVHWYLPCGIVNPWAINDAALHTPNKIVRQTWLLYQFGDHILPLPPREPGDGASIPRLAQFLFGYDPIDDSLWAAEPHDYVCKHPEVLPRAIGDAIFGHVLEAVHQQKKLRRRDALRKFWAVRLYTRLLEVCTRK